MKMRLLLAFVGLAIGLTAPTLAQQKDTIDSQIAEQVTKKIDEGFNNGDAAGIGAPFRGGRAFCDSSRTYFRSGGHREAFCRDVPARALQQPSQQGRSGFPSHDRYGWQ